MCVCKREREGAEHITDRKRGMDGSLKTKKENGFGREKHRGGF